MASRYWVGGTGNWSDNTNHWAASSGGAPGASLPTSVDDVFFDANSFLSAGGAMTIDIVANCKSMNWTGVLNTPIWSGSFYINIYGSLTMIPAMSFPYSGSLYFLSASTGNTITTGATGYVMNTTYFQGGGEWTLQNNYVASTSIIHLTKGTLITNGKNLTSYYLYCEPTALNEASLVLSSSTVTARSITINDFCILSAGTSLVKVTAGNLNPGTGKAFYDVQIIAGNQVINGENTFNSLVVTNGGSSTLVTYFYGSVTVTGSGGISLTSGSIAFNAANVTTTKFISTSTSSGVGKVIYFKDGHSINLTGTGTVWDLVPTGPQFQALTSTITVSGVTATFSGQGLSYPSLVISPSSVVTLTGSNTFTDINIYGGGTLKVAASTTQIATISTPTPSLEAILQSTSAGSSFTLTKSSGQVNVQNIAISDSVATGGARWQANYGRDLGGNTGWQFVRIDLGFIKGRRSTGGFLTSSSDASKLQANKASGGFIATSSSEAKHQAKKATGGFLSSSSRNP